MLSAVPLQLPVTSGDPRATSNIELGVNVPAAATVVTEQAQFADGYEFNPDDPTTFTNSTSITILLFVLPVVGMVTYKIPAS